MSYSFRGRGNTTTGSHRGRGRGIGFQSNEKRSSVRLPPERSLMEGLSASPIGAFDRSTLCFVQGAERLGSSAHARVTADVHDPLQITDAECIGSYNWVEAKHPTIIVPGAPRVWKNRQLPFRVPMDNEIMDVQVINQNQHRMGNNLSLLPIFETVDTLSRQGGGTDFQWSEVDFVTDRNSLRNFIRWIDDTEKLDDFRIDLHLAGRMSILLVRWSTTTVRAANPSFGLSFEREAASFPPDCKSAVGYHRIVKYDFGGLDMVVRYVADACLSLPQVEDKPAEKVDIDSLTSAFASTSLHGATAGRDPPSITVKFGGVMVPQEFTVELTTRSIKNVDGFDWAEAVPQLFLSQTPHHMLAVHRHGTFESVRHRCAEDGDFERFERASQQSFRRLRILLEEIQELVVEHGHDGRLSLVCRSGELKVYNRESEETTLPKDVLQKFQ